MVRERAIVHADPLDPLGRPLFPVVPDIQQQHRHTHRDDSNHEGTKDTKAGGEEDNRGRENDTFILFPFFVSFVPSWFNLVSARRGSTQRRGAGTSRRSGH